MSYYMNAICKKYSFQSGQILINVIIIGSLSVIVMGSFVQWATLQIKAARQLKYREQAFAIAEAGAEYYRWHLAHAPEDFQDGTGVPGPYVHEYKNKDGDTIGRFTLTITPPPAGSTIVTVTSKGEVYAASTARSVKVTLGIPSWTKYSVAANDNMRFGSGTEVFGAVHSNAGIRFDGVAHNKVTSAKDKYQDPDHSGANEFGVHTHVSPVDPLPPSAVPNRPDVFKAGREFPVPALDFSGLTSDLSNLKTDAQNNGLYFANSGAQGYAVVLKTDDTFDLYKATSLVTSPGGCRDNAQGWGTWSVQNQIFIATYAFPQNGIIFFEDHVWVEGTIDGARLTIASGRFPESSSTDTNITVNKNLIYTRYDGTDTLGLIAQNNFNVGLKSDDELTIDGALAAKNGRVGRFYYKSQCGAEYIRNSLTLHGSIITNKRYGFAYTDGTGYQTRNLYYDANLLYSPPPNFPLTSDQYTVMSWEEVK